MESTSSLVKKVPPPVGPGAFPEWLSRQGYRVIQTPSSYWCQCGPRVFQAFPYHWLIHPDDEELNELFRDHRAIGLRYSTSISSFQGIVSYHVVYEGPSYTLSELPKKARYDVRKGLNHANIEPVTFERLAREGWKARAETLQRQGRVGAESSTWWEKTCRSANDLPGFEAWAALINGNIVASLLSFTDGDCCSILYQQSMTEHLRSGVNNALTYKFTEEMLVRSGISRVFYGLHSLDAPASVDEFKFRMRFTAKPVRQRVVFHPALEPFFNRVTHSTLKSVVGKYPANPSLAKAEGLIRFYLQGRQKLYQQPWPECLADRKEEIMRMASVTN